MWLIKLTGDNNNRQRAIDIYGFSYFNSEHCRAFHYKKDAKNLLSNLSRRGIKAELKDNRFSFK